MAPELERQPMTLTKPWGSSFSSSSPLVTTPSNNSINLQISKHKRGIRNGPKALKPTPVIVRCKCCGRVRLPHFYCCGGRREEPGERSDAAN